MPDIISDWFKSIQPPRNPNRGNTELRGKLQRAAQLANVPDDVADEFASVVGLESGWRQRNKQGGTLTSPQDARGVSQILPGTIAKFRHPVTGRSLNIDRKSVV